MGFASDDVRFFAFGISLPANNAFMSQSSSDVVKSGASGNDCVGSALVLGQQLGNPSVVEAEQLCEIAVGEQSALLVGLFTEAERFPQHPLASWKAIDAQLRVLGGRDIEEDGDQLGIGNAFLTSGRVVDADGHPEHLTMHDMVLGAHVLDDNLKNHIGT